MAVTQWAQKTIVGGQNSGRVAISRVVKWYSNRAYDPISGFLVARAIDWWGHTLVSSTI